jgi:hypothetical protein
MIRLRNPRPIPLDDDAIREDVEGICDKLREWAEEEIAIRKSDGVNPDWPLQASHNTPIVHYDMKAKTVTGKRRVERIVVSVIVTERENSNRIVIGGDASLWTGTKERPVPPEGRVTLRLNAKLTPATLITATRGGYTAPAFEGILRILRHELTHVGDWNLGRVESGYVSSTKGEIAKEDWSDYYNDPLEVSAFASEVADEVRRFVSLNSGLRHPYLATAAIESSKQFERMRPYLTPANERKVLQVAYRAIEDERGPAAARAEKIRAMQERMKGRRDNPARPNPVYDFMADEDTEEGTSLLHDVIVGAWNSDKEEGDVLTREDVENAFREPGALDGADFVYARYDSQSWSGEAVVLFVRGGRLWFVSATHCSCMGLEEQWKPERVTMVEPMREWSYVKSEDVEWAERAMAYAVLSAPREGEDFTPRVGHPHTSARPKLLRRGAEETAAVAGHVPRAAAGRRWNPAEVARAHRQRRRRTLRLDLSPGVRAPHARFFLLATRTRREHVGTKAVAADLAPPVERRAPCDVREEPLVVVAPHGVPRRLALGAHAGLYARPRAYAPVERIERVAERPLAARFKLLDERLRRLAAHEGDHVEPGAVHEVVVEVVVAAERVELQVVAELLVGRERRLKRGAGFKGHAPLGVPGEEREALPRPGPGGRVVGVAHAFEPRGHVVPPGAREGGRRGLVRAPRRQGSSDGGVEVGGRGRVGRGRGHAFQTLALGVV